MEKKWINVTKSLPKVGERVLVWIRYKGQSGFDWTESEIEDPPSKAMQKFHYKEPNTNSYWCMGSAKGYEICGWMRIPKMWE